MFDKFPVVQGTLHEVASCTARHAIRDLIVPVTIDSVNSDASLARWPAVFGVHHFVLIVTVLLEVGSAERWLRDVVASRWRTTLEGTIQTSISRKAIQWILDWHDHRRCGIPLTCRAHWVAWKWHAGGWYDPDDDARIWMRIMLR